MLSLARSLSFQEDDENKRSLLQQLLGLSDDEANEIRAASQAEGGGTKVAEEDEAFF